MAVDGTVLDAAASGANIDAFTVPAGGRLPQVRAVTIVACATRAVLAAAIDACSVGEQVLWDRLATSLHPGMILLADRNFYCLHRWSAAAATGAHLAWRVKDNLHALGPHRLLSVLADGSALIELSESDGMRRARRKSIGDPQAPRLAPVTARLIRFTVTLTDDTGKATTSPFTILTTLSDPQVAPAGELAAAYERRWQIELAYKAIKTTLRGGPRRLRPTSPALVEQETWAMLAVYNLIVAHAVAAATDLGVEVTAVNLTLVLATVRDHLAAAAPCPRCGHHRPETDLHAAITAAPRQRTDRRRTTPRAPTTRATGTRNVTATINITPQTAALTSTKTKT